ncbi:hypothetical protein [Streptomyces pyxinae]|uniref:hypothetical protein n=1 Tax=Streptomyces pyxinae TaxID=2970734 RepID=UPI002867D2C7|nr:hypothetical protein [Streptomyces sp. LP05-1]
MQPRQPQTRPDRPGPAPAAPADPFRKAWVDTELRALAEEARARGAGARRESTDRLLEALWPWALRTARAQAARVPAGADRDAVQGEVLWEVFQAVRRIDWQRYEVWPALLKARLRNAWTGAARAEDPLSRGERRSRTAYLRYAEAETHRLRRTLTPAERTALARRCRPDGAASGVEPVLLGRVLLAVGAVPDAGTAPGEAGQDPAVLLQRRWLGQAVRAWVAQDLPPGLGREVAALLDRDEGDRLSGTLLRRIRPYAEALSARLGGEP